MKRLLGNHVALLLGVMFAFLLASGSVAAQSQNLLTNPGFEQPFSSVAGTPPRQVAQGWTPWNIGGGQSASENVQPEYYPASDVTNGLGVPRFRNGTDAQQYWTFFATHDGGLFQRVTGVTSGQQLRFSAYVYVWSSAFDDPNTSEDPGGVVVQVGIDPAGGTDGSSSSIVWSAPSIQYDSYNEYSVTASATGTAVTVWVRSTVTTPVKNTNIYVDDASLGSASGAVPTNTSVVAATATRTNVPPTATVVVPTATRTNVPPTSTTVVQSPTATGVVVQSPTATGVVVEQPTATVEVIQPTNTIEVVIPTSTTAPVEPTATQEISATSTPVGGVDNVQFPGRIVHIVRSGDTVGNLATLYGSNIDAIIASNNLPESALIKVGQGLVIPVRLLPPATSTPTATPLVPVATATSDVNAPIPGNIYIIQPGDTLGRIAARFNTTIATLAQLNGITNPNTIYSGQRLIIPVVGDGGGLGPAPQPQPATSTPVPVAEPTTYIVRYGDSLFNIALRFRVTVSQLVQANGISDPNRVYVGQRLVIP